MATLKCVFLSRKAQLLTLSLSLSHFLQIEHTFPQIYKKLTGKHVSFKVTS